MTSSAGVGTPFSDAGGADEQFMRRALALADGGWGQTAPNPLVGAVIVADGQIVGEGFHARYGEAHAEVNALRRAGARARGATVYVTLEPCAHFGKTPPCVAALIAAGVAHVVVAVRDPSAIARGGVELLRDAGIRVDVGVGHAAALELNAPFFNAHASDLPWVTLKLAVSADGRLADPSGVRRWITGPESRLEVHKMRANADAIAVGVGTVLADDPALTVRDVAAPRVPPWRVVFDRRLRTPLASALVQTARDVPTLLLGAPDRPPERVAALRAAGVEVVLVDGLRAQLAALRARGVRSLFAEGGAQLAGSLLREGLVHRLVIFRSPVVFGGTTFAAFDGAPEHFERALADRPPIARRTFGDDVMTTYALQDVPCSPV